MACDFSALDQIDTSDPAQLDSLMQECTSALLSPELWAWAIGITIVGAIVGAWIGRKRKSMVRDALLGAALGPIGWAISLRLANRPAPKKCSGCGVLVGDSDAYCKSCGRKLL
jgi:hypothetical protein